MQLIDYITQIGLMKRIRLSSVYCNNEHYHGHNYDLEVRLTGEIDPDTGYVYDMKALADLIEEFVEKRFDHKNLNVDVPDFQNLRPSAENIAMVIYNILRKKLIKLGHKSETMETPEITFPFPVKE